MLNPFFDRFEIEFCSLLGLPNLQNNGFPLRKFMRFQTFVFRKWHRFLIDLGANMEHGSILASQILPNLSKIRSQDASIFRSIFAFIFPRFSFDFGSQLGAMLAFFRLKYGGLI